MPFLKKFNDELSSNNKDDIAIIMSEGTKLSYVVSHYALHRLRANVNFSAIEKKYAVNENRSIHHLYGSGPQTKRFLD